MSDTPGDDAPLTDAMVMAGKLNVLDWHVHARDLEHKLAQLKRERDALAEKVRGLETAPLCDNPSGEYCPDCRSVGMSHCADPINCGGLQKMACRYAEISKTTLKLRALQAIVDTELVDRNALAEKVRMALGELGKMRLDHILSGSPGPLYNAGWSAAIEYWSDRLYALLAEQKDGE